MDHVTKRRNGKYTCLDCTRDCTKECDKCKNWHKFSLNKEIQKLPYIEKSSLHDKIKGIIKKGY